MTEQLTLFIEIPEVWEKKTGKTTINIMNTRTFQGNHLYTLMKRRIQGIEFSDL